MSGRVDAELGLSCPQCQAARDIYRYCMNCGFDFAGSEFELGESEQTSTVVEGALYAAQDDVDLVDTADRPMASLQSEPVPSGPAYPGPTSPVPTNSGQPPLRQEPAPAIGGRSAPALVGLIAAAVVVLLLIGAAMVSIMGGDDSKSTPTGGVAAKPSTSAQPDPDTKQPTCWDGRSVPLLTACGQPSGKAGLKWVFPSFDRKACRNQTRRTAGAASPKLVVWACSVEVPDGGEALIRYRELGAVAAGLATYDKNYGKRNRTEALSKREDVERLIWTSTRANNNGIWSLTSMYVDYPWAVTVQALSAADRDYAFSKLVEFRNPRRMVGRPARQ